MADGVEYPTGEDGQVESPPETGEDGEVESPPETQKREESTGDLTELLEKLKERKS
jgi:hypothetical protein